MKEQVFKREKFGFSMLPSTLRGIGEAALDFVLPPRCAACGALTQRHVGVCAACWSDLNFITRPFCERCGRPFEFYIPGTSQCAACLRRPPAFDKAFSPLVYGETSRDIILQFKHGDQLGHAALLASLMVPHMAHFGYSDPYIMPVPLHRRRIIQRRFNQSAMIAQALAKQLSVQADVLTLQRTRATPMQQGLNAAQRRRNVQGAFAVARRRAARVRGRDIVLIDDVLTTGATVEACARVLRKAGASQIGVLTAARVVAPETAAI